jgi:hypothetical protein
LQRLSCWDEALINEALIMLFIGRTAGVAAHVLIPGLPEGFAFAATFAALTTQVGTLQIAPVAIAALTSYLAVSGTGALMALADRGRDTQNPAPKPPKPSTRLS